ncbi:MSHA pilin protein MshC [Colwellia chukchiensis]|uniref:MSHA pilin protein MshC n=1 Tax=Colwellia chukchiensis TaxID=641665 RepID=A0A1H7LBA9_9GAMM|nr:type II secretion system protein [Colwellia chukchiensis]SEK95805.1 MSHA pilin protein MshC [Colwellia chukchiensis]
MKALHKQQGFTLVELVVVIIILGILAVSVAPKFFSAKGFAEYGYQSDIIAKLRLIQTKAMQQTNTAYCHRVLITASQLGAPDDCDNNPSFSLAWQPSATGLVITASDNVTLSSNIAGNSFTFDSMGRPSCGTCIISVNGEQTLQIKIESEGYIHAL